MIMMITWEIWCERNNYIFRQKQAKASDITQAVRRSTEQWRLAGAKAIESPFGDFDARWLPLFYSGRRPVTHSLCFVFLVQVSLNPH